MGEHFNTYHFESSSWIQFNERGSYCDTSTAQAFRAERDKLRAELETANENAKLWFDTAAEKAGELDTARQELDRMTGAFVNYSMASYCSDEDVSNRMLKDREKAAKIREKYGFDKS